MNTVFVIKQQMLTYVQWQNAGHNVPFRLSGALIEACMKMHEQGAEAQVTAEQLIKVLNLFNLQDKLRKVPLYRCMTCGTEGYTVRPKTRSGHFRSADPNERYCKKCGEVNEKEVKGDDHPWANMTEEIDEDPWADMTDETEKDHWANKNYYSENYYSAWCPKWQWSESTSWSSGKSWSSENSWSSGTSWSSGRWY